MAKVTGIGGVFFRSANNKELAQWYHKHLGLPLAEWGGGVLNWQDDKSEDKGLTVWHIAEKNTSWFSPSQADFMINYRIDNMDEMIAKLKKGGVDILQGPESHENGKFAWIVDPEGHKVELWEPMIWDDKNKKINSP
jgi:predicted enzyme related to lactoylglutathione lyase